MRPDYLNRINEGLKFKGKVGEVCIMQRSKTQVKSEKLVLGHNSEKESNR